jgi:hypothetical protein
MPIELETGLWSRYLGALGLDIDCVQRLARSHEQPVSLGAAEAKVRAGFRKMDLADEGTVGREHVHPVVALQLGS